MIIQHKTKETLESQSTLFVWALIKSIMELIMIVSEHCDVALIVLINLKKGSDSKTLHCINKI